MEKDEIEHLIKRSSIRWQRHAFERMLERGITKEAVKNVLKDGEIIENYPGDYPLPSALILGSFNKKVLHVVVAFDQKKSIVYIVTAYHPDSEHFEDDFKTRKK